MDDQGNDVGDAGGGARSRSGDAGAEGRASARGLIGGDLETRARTARVPPLDHPFVLAPYRKDGDEERTREFLAHRPLHIEIGFGRPHYLVELAKLHPDAHVLGFEIKRDWVRAAANRAERDGVANVRVIEGDARPHLERLVEPGSVDGLHVLFPDPWWKKRHHKRRVFTADFTALLARLIAPGGDLVTKTDVPAYVDQMIEECLAQGLELAGQGSADPLLAALPRSHREKKCLELAVPFHMLRFRRRSA
jgi:tRNA (guanine-N7-)-methyltransferase